jgi:hypothetical protein
VLFRSDPVHAARVLVAVAGAAEEAVVATMTPAPPEPVGSCAVAGSGKNSPVTVYGLAEGLALAETFRRRQGETVELKRAA